MNTLLAILKVIDARRDVILAGGLSHLFAWRHLPRYYFGSLQPDEAKLKTYLKINVSI